ncbi:MAG: DNA-formamidopyrimidine glycosylase family protein, partial [Streptosporangiaceae bacterium]
MPEGHAIHRLAKVVKQRFAGDALAVSSPQGRFAAAAARLDGQTLRCVDAYGKHLFLDFGDDRWVHLHLGVYGRLIIVDLPTLPPIGQVRMRLV